jgi:hypothetical protein
LITQAEAVHYQAGSEFLPLIEEVNKQPLLPSHRSSSTCCLEHRCAWFLPCMALARFLGTLGCQHMRPNLLNVMVMAARVLFHAGVPHANIQDGADPRRQGGEQQVLPLRPFPLRPGGGMSPYISLFVCCNQFAFFVSYL